MDASWSVLGSNETSILVLWSSECPFNYSDKAVTKADTVHGRDNHLDTQTMLAVPTKLP